MKSISRTLFIIGLIGIIAIGTFAYGFRLGGNVETTNISTEFILERISDKYFVVTRTVVMDEQTQIVIDKGGDWSNLLWGQKIDAKAKVRVDLGVDMTSLNPEDITIDNSNKTISIKMPHAEILNMSIIGNFDVESKDGLLKNLFNDTTNEDYNNAIKIMKDNASKEVMKDKELLKNAENSATNLLDLILDNLGYKVEFVFE